MTQLERENWIDNIESSSSVISSLAGGDDVANVLQKYGAHNVEDLDSSVLQDVFSELYAIQADLQ